MDINEAIAKLQPAVGLSLSIMWDADPVDPTCLRLTLTHLDWTKTEIKTISSIFVGHPDSIAKSKDAALAAGVWQKET